MNLALAMGVVPASAISFAAPAMIPSTYVVVNRRCLQAESIVCLFGGATKRPASRLCAIKVFYRTKEYDSNAETEGCK